MPYASSVRSRATLAKTAQIGNMTTNELQEVLELRLAQLDIAPDSPAEAKPEQAEGF